MRENFIFVHAAELDIDIAKDTIYTTMGSAVSIIATVYISNQTVFTILWYHNGSLINTTSNPRYSLTTEGINIHSLRVINVDTDVLGRYDVVATTEDNTSQNDTVWLMLAGELI